MDKNALIQRAWTELEPLLEAGGYELVEVEIGGLGSSPVLRLYIDKAGGVGVEDCGTASRLLGPALDDGEWFPGNYMLEMSSPGIDRPVRKAADFARFQGETLRVQTHAPVAGRKKFTGTLDGFENGEIRLVCADGPVALHVDNVKRANLDSGL